MKSLVLNTVLTAAVAVASTAAAFGQCQTGRIPVNQELHDAAATVVATVDSVYAVPETEAHLDGVEYVVRIDRTIKGKVAQEQTVRIFSENSEAKFPMQVGKQYLLFVHKADADYQVDNCGNSGLIAATNVTNAASLKAMAEK